MALNQKLPDFLIIGAMKCGTSSLYEYVNQHPDISMSATKEINFFSDEPNWEKGLEWYCQQFTNDNRLCGEASHNYSNHPRMPAAKRIADTIPNAKLIYSVRDPLQRIQSHYVQRWMLRLETRPIEEALTHRFPNNPYIARSKYYFQIEQYLRHFASENILVVENRDLKTNTAETLSKVFDFLEVPPFSTEKFQAQHNVAVSKKQLSPFGERARMWILSTFKPPQSVRNKLGAMYRHFGTDEKPPTMTPELKEKISIELKPDVQQFEEFCGRKFDHWQTKSL